jgi:two-component system sensor histidine kinase VicK
VKISKILVTSTAISLGIIGLLIILLTRTITTPVSEITSQATAMANGDFDRRVSIKSDDEIGKLAKAFNHLASHLREALTEKEEEKKKLETVLANMTDGVIATDSEGKVIVRNHWAEKLLQRKIGLGEKIDQILPLTEPIRLKELETSQQLLGLNPENGEDWTVLQITFSPIKRGFQEVVGLIAVLSDVTEKEKLDRQRKDFVANVSHELRTPLTTIKSYLEALADGAMEEPELAKRFLNVTQQEADRMTRLIQDLLQLSRLDAKRVTLNRKITSIPKILEEVVDRFSFQTKQKQIELGLKIENLLPTVIADRDKLTQVLDNILSNAVKYTPEGGKITIGAKKRSDGMVEVVVEDTGIGIPKKDLSRIFERFYRVDKARSRQMGGTGLGLAIAQEIVHLHGGNIWIESEYRKGTKVFFTLPTSYRR